MKVTILGCGTSTGVPVPNCSCSVCHSEDPRNSRLRASVLIHTKSSQNIVIDTSPDFRQQALKAKFKSVDAVLYTHAHADHMLGLDDLRSFNYSQQAAIPCYATEITWKDIERTFEYVFKPNPDYKGGGLPRIDRKCFKPFDELAVGQDKIATFQLMHGSMEVMGFRYETFAYATDCNHIPERSIQIMKGIKILVLDALRQTPHPTHFTIDEAISIARKIGAKRTIFTHCTHSVDYNEISKILPAGFELAYDGMEINLS